MPVDVQIVPIDKEIEFEKALVDMLIQHGWSNEIIMNPTEKDLIKNWANIIYNNNRDINRLGDYPLTDSEMQQVMNRVNALKNPYEANIFINGGIVFITRDNKDDKNNYGCSVPLKIFDAREIRAGQSIYQIVRQPRFETAHPLAGDRRGDVMLLINGMPVFHIELKRSGVDVSQATNQIKKYAHEGVFARGLFSLVQVFVAMTPEKTLYFANPGAEENFSPSFYFHWANFNNEETFDWKQIAANLLSIPMAHQMVGYYTIADDKDKTLKVLRSYQYFATNRICEVVHNTNWDNHSHRGGFIWHTTGSGKTMTSFKSAQLIAKAGDADKVVFLLDRIELSTQSADEYRGFANADDNVLDTDDTANLISLLESDSKDDCLIVTSLQKMSRVNGDHGVSEATIKKINGKRVVFIVDECHRSVTGTGRGDSGGGMLLGIKNTFDRALMFGFTGTPVFEENARGEITTEVIFGDMLHKYTLADGIPDKNVLGFDLYREDTFKEEDLREIYALRKLEIESVDDIQNDPEMLKKYEEYKNETDILKVEDAVKSIYTSEAHHIQVMQKIVIDRPIIGHNGKFHAILATKNIPEAIEYYRLFKAHYPSYNVAAIFDDSIDNEGHGEYREDAILEMLDDYNNKFGTQFKQSNYAKYKKDVAKRLAHKEPYRILDKNKQIDLLIVVTQMLTGYDSKWVNTLYVDKIMYYIDVIQSFSRTNRLFGPEKPFGIIKYFTRPNLMANNIDDALELYVNQPLSVFVDKLEANLEKINKAFDVIDSLFKAEGIANYSCLPKAESSRKKFAKEFCEMTKRIEASKMQGFTWEKDEYEFQHGNGWITIKMKIDEETYKILLQRYRELFERTSGGDGDDDDDVYEIDAYIAETGAGTIDADYINSRFIRFVKYLYTTGLDSEMAKATQLELHRAFATFSQRDQRTALTILRDIQSGDLRLEKDKTIYDYINDYQKRESDRLVYTMSEITGLNADKLLELVRANVNESNIDEQHKFDDLMDTFDDSKAAVFYEKVTGQTIDELFLMACVIDIVRRFIIYPDDRAKIIFAYQNEGYFIDQNVPEEIPVEETPVEPVQTEIEDEEEAMDMAKIKSSIKTILSDPNTLGELLPSMRSLDEIVESVFLVAKATSIPSLDGVGPMIIDDFNDLFGGKKISIVKRHKAFNNLATKFEAYLKKLYYLIHGCEVTAPDGSAASWSNVIYGFHYNLWNLKYMHSPGCQRVYQYLLIAKDWRNDGSHIAPTATEEELNAAIQVIVTLYFYATGTSITDLETTDFFDQFD